MAKTINGNSLPVPTILKVGSSATPIAILGGLALLAVGGFYFAKKWREHQIAKENEKAAVDPNVNIASKIYSENRATYTQDNVIIDLFKQITDFKAVNDSYKAYGKDLLSDTRDHVSSASYQQILNILGIKSGAIKTTSTTAQQAQTVVQNQKPQWLITKVDARLRKTPMAGSAVFTLRSNIISTIKTGMIVGFRDTAAIKNNKGQLFYDTENSVFFIPVKVFDAIDLRKTYTAYIAASNVDVVEGNIPKDKELLRISKFMYDLAFGTSGLQGLEGKLI